MIMPAPRWRAIFTCIMPMIPSPMIRIDSPRLRPERASDLTTHAAGSTSTPLASSIWSGSFRVSRWLVALTRKYSAIPPGSRLVARQVAHCTYSPRRHAAHWKAGRMMMHENAVARLEAAHRRACLLDHTYRLVAEHQRRLAPDVPGHDIAGADAAGAWRGPNIVGAGFWALGFFDPDIAEIVKTCDSHGGIELCVPRRCLSTAQMRGAVAFAPVAAGVSPADAKRPSVCAGGSE